MITTVDKVTLKQWQYAYEIGITNDGEYRPTRGVVHGGSNRITNPDKCWSTYALCQIECDKLNND